MGQKNACDFILKSDLKGAKIPKFAYLKGIEYFHFSSNFDVLFCLMDCVKSFQ